MVGLLQKVSEHFQTLKLNPEIPLTRAAEDPDVFAENLMIPSFWTDSMSTLMFPFDGVRSGKSFFTTLSFR